jgi:hypothetical protein
MPSKIKSTRCQLNLRLLKDGLVSVSAHGIGRAVNSKVIHLRILWFLAVSSCCCIFCWNLPGFVEKLKSPGMTTSFYSTFIFVLITRYLAVDFWLPTRVLLLMWRPFLMKLTQSLKISAIHCMRLQISQIVLISIEGKFNFV